MYARYDSFNRFEIPLITLCNPGSVIENNAPTKVVGILSDVTDEEIVANFNAISEFNFVVHRVHREDTEEDNYTKTLYKAIQPRRLVFVKDIGYFIITQVNEDYEPDGGVFKDVRAESIEQEIQNKKIPYIADNTYKFYDSFPESKSILKTLVDALPLWEIGHVDETVMNRYRTFEDISPDLNILGFIYENVQDAYECIFIFDTINRIINVYDQNNYVRKTSVHLSWDDVVNNLNITEDAENLYTAMTVLGSDNVMISALNPLGTNTIYDFSHYITWMTPSLGTKVQTWQQQVKSKEANYKDLNLQYYTKNDNLLQRKHDLEALNTQITIYRRCRDNIVAESNTDSIKDYNKVIVANGGAEIDVTAEISQAMSQIDSLIRECEYGRSAAQNDISRIEKELDVLRVSINTIRETLSITRYFTNDELKELSNYIFEGSYSDDYVVFTDIMSYTEKFEQMETLYRRAKETLDKAAHPIQQFDINSENFLFIKEFEHFTEQLETGCLINMEVETDDVALLFLSNFTVNYDDHSFKMTFSSRYRKFDAKTLFENVLGKISKSSNTLGFIKDTIFPIKNGELNKMQEAIETSRDLTLDVAMSSSGEDVVIDGTGYTGRKKLKTGGYDPRQIKINGRNIVFTDNAWETCKTAIGEIVLGDNASTYGINAQTLIGEMIVGNKLKIVDNQGNDMFKVMDDKININLSDYDKRISNIEANAGELKIEITELGKNSGKASSVTTTSGYVFDEDGLTIHKSGNEMTNLLDNTGMYVKRNDVTILEANNNGVIAINLTARQYLHMGTYSRFEDYSNGVDTRRTACFYLDNTGV